jgi:hypothetical protein
MHRQKFGADRGSAPGSASNGIRNIVKLKVEKNIFAECAQSLNDLRPGGSEKLAANLVELARVAKALDHRQREISAGKIECHDRDRVP